MRGLAVARTKPPEVEREGERSYRANLFEFPYASSGTNAVPMLAALVASIVSSAYGKEEREIVSSSDHIPLARL